MINNIEGQSKSELIKIVTEQQSHDVQREAYIKSLQADSDNLRTQLANANERIKELESDLIRKSSAFDYVNKHASNMTRRLTNVDEQLAKANKRIAELESYNVRLANESHEYQQRCTELEKDLLRQSVFMEKTAEKLEQHREWQATASVLRRPTREARKAVNKFAIEKKIESLGEIKDKWIKKAAEMPLGLECRSKGASCYNWAMYYAKELTDEVEQLRKEQASD